MEEWRSLYFLGYSKYEVSSLGNVRNTNTLKNLKINTDRYGYPCINLSKSKYGKKTFRIHRLVALAFLLELEDKLEVNHINGIKNDNRVENLEWCNRKENQHHAIKLGLVDIKKMNNLSSLARRKAVYKLNPLTYEIIDKYDSLMSAEKLTNVKRSNICNCCKGRTYEAGNFKWMYVIDYERRTSNASPSYEK